MPISVSTSLPDCVLNALKQFADVIVRDGEIPVIELVESREGKSVFIKFLHDNSEVDPLLSPAFGNPLNPYVSPIAQVEVFNLLATYQPLLLPDLAANVFPFIPAQLPVMAGFQYHQSKRAILAVQEEIQNPTRFANMCPGLCATDNGNVICDLSIIFGNAVIVIRIHKASWP